MESIIGRNLSEEEVSYYRSLTPAQKVQLTYELSQLLKSANSNVNKERDVNDCSFQHDKNQRNTDNK